MKGIGLFIVLIIIVGGILVLSHKSEAPGSTDESSANQMTQEETAATEQAVTGDTAATLSGSHEIDAAASSANWTGGKHLIKDYIDRGTINIKSGNAVFTDDVLTGGQVVFDMNSIATLETGRGNDADNTSQQARHMKSPDFFDAANFPESKFVITSAEKAGDVTYNLTGDLTIKDKTNSVSFPVEVSNESGVITISGSATLDRTLWDIKYGSSKFFASLGDNVIDDEFTLDFQAVLK